MTRRTRIGLAVLVAVVCACVYGAFGREDASASRDSDAERWLGLVYPDRANLLRHEVIGEFQSLNECLERVRAAASEQSAYECGLNCRERPSGLNVCERTVGNER